jgi:hypothetical protein
MGLGRKSLGLLLSMFSASGKLDPQLPKYNQFPALIRTFDFHQCSRGHHKYIQILRGIELSSKGWILAVVRALI